MDEVFAFLVCVLPVLMVVAGGIAAAVRVFGGDSKQELTSLRQRIAHLEQNLSQTLQRLAALERWANERVAEDAARTPPATGGEHASPLPAPAGPSAEAPAPPKVRVDTSSFASDEVLSSGGPRLAAAPLAEPELPATSAPAGETGLSPAPFAIPYVAEAKGGPAPAAPLPPLELPSSTPATSAPASGHAPAASPALPNAPLPPTPPPAGPPPAGPSAPASPSGAPKGGWERWIGVVATAGLGAVVLVIAGFYFFRFAVDAGYLGPTVRVILGTLTGLSLVVGSERALRRETPVLANWLAGAGVAILYTSFWAGTALFELIPTLAGFGLMAGVTVVAGVLSVRRDSLAIAGLGLLGGFSTPVMLASGSDNTLGLFGYILLLDLGIVAIARKKQWPWLALFALLGTTVYQGLWILGRADSLGMALLIVSVFAALFALAPVGIESKEDEPAHGLWRGASFIGLLLPFFFTLYFALHAKLGSDLWPLGLFMGLLSAVAIYVGQRDRAPHLAQGAAAASLAVVFAWVVQHPLDGARTWEFLGTLAGLTLLHGLALERLAQAPRLAAATTTLGGLALTVLASGAAPPNLWPFFAYWLFTLVGAYRQAKLTATPAAQPLAAALVALGLGLFHAVHQGEDGGFSEPTYYALAGFVLIATHALALLRRDAPARTLAERGAVLASAILVAASMASDTPYLAAPATVLGAIALYSVLGLLGSTRLGDGRWVLVLMGVAALAQVRWTLTEPDLTGGAGRVGFGLQAMTLLVFLLWPLLAARRLREDLWTWRAAALAPIFWFVSLRELYLALFGAEAIGLLPIFLGALVLGVAITSRARGPRDEADRRTAFVWLIGVTTGFVTLAIPLQLENEWVTIAWALEGAVLVGLWKRLTHPGLRHFGFALLMTVSVRLVFNPWLLEYHLRGEVPGLVWLSYTFLVPVGCLLFAGAVLRGREREHMAKWERDLFRGTEISPYATLSVLAAVAAGFVYVNLVVFDIYVDGEHLVIPSDRMPARDLTLSLTWAVYGLVLLVAGVRSRSRGLRGLSLLLVLVTVGKVFLYDLGALEDLYRVASLAGLAVSLILISFAYQRFVFRDDPKEPS